MLIDDKTRLKGSTKSVQGGLPVPGSSTTDPHFNRPTAEEALSKGSTRVIRDGVRAVELPLTRHRPRLSLAFLTRIATCQSLLANISKDIFRCSDGETGLPVFQDSHWADFGPGHYVDRTLGMSTSFCVNKLSLQYQTVAGAQILLSIQNIYNTYIERYWQLLALKVASMSVQTLNDTTSFVLQGVSSSSYNCFRIPSKKENTYL
jgi:hypothetical protein